MRRNISIQPIDFERGSALLPLFFSPVYAIRKKHKISSRRLADLKRPDNIYIIGCITGDCHCHEKHNMQCSRGFFSLFLQVLYGIRFALRYQLSYYIDFGNGQYAYSDPEKFGGDLNFWNYYFEQPLHKKEVQRATTTVNLHYETYPLRIWHKKFLRDMSAIFHNHIVLKKEIKIIIDRKLQLFKQQKILGVHIRGTDHYMEIEPVAITKFINLIDKKRSTFDKVFLATDDEKILNTLINKFGEEAIIYHHVIRSPSEMAIHTSLSFQNPYQLGLEAVIDCYCLAHCAEAILVHSNLSFAALVLNPDLPYTLMETRKSAIKRLKTQLLYDLDRWGIRTL